MQQEAKDEGPNHEEAMDEEGMDEEAMDVSCARSLRASPFSTHLTNNLLSPVLEIKILSVRLMQQSIKHAEVQAILDVAMQFLETPVEFKKVRQIAMLIRRIVMLQKTVSFDSSSQRIVPYLLLGFLYPQATPIMKDVLAGIAILCEDPAVEELVCIYIVQCLQIPKDDSLASDSTTNEYSQMAAPCRGQFSNLRELKHASRHVSGIADEYEQDLDKLVRVEEASSVDGKALVDRLKALQVFMTIPHAAEKRSRLVVPLFLSIRSPQDQTTLSLKSSPSQSSHSPRRKWSFPERKAFLELFGKFKNPRVLFKSSDAFEALLDFLSVGQAEIQKLALKALFTWGLPSVRKHEGSLLKLTDEAKYRDELTMLFHVDTESSTILDDDRNELLPILLRLLLGQMTNRSGSNRNYSGQEAKRKITLQMLFRLHDDEILQFLDLAFGKVSVEIGMDGSLRYNSGLTDFISTEKQYGLVKSAKSMLETLESQMPPFGQRILRPVLYCLFQACRNTDSAHTCDDSPLPDSQSSLCRNTRKTAIHCLRMIFQNCDSITWSAYLPYIFEYVISPRLENFPIETSQGISVLLQLFAVWASSSGSVSCLHDYQESLLDRVADCLSTPATKDEVKIYVLDQIFSKLVKLSSKELDPTERNLAIVRSHMPHLLSNLAMILEEKQNGKLLDSAVELLVNLAPLIKCPTEIEELITVIASLLREPPRKLSPKVKGNLLQAVIDLLPHLTSTRRCADELGLRKTVAVLFNYFTDIPNRQKLAQVLEILAFGDEQARDIGSLCSALNAVSINKLDEIDYDSRLKAFNLINAMSVGDFSLQLWEPIVQNLIFFARASDDFAIRSHATSSLRRFIIGAAELQQPDFDTILQSTILEALKRSAKTDSESIRADHIAMLGLLVQKCPNCEEIKDLQGLLAGNDEEASFFGNILHIQYHRRARAMRRLAAEAELGALRSSTICNFLLPLLEKFIFDPRDDDGIRNLRGQAISTVGTLLRWTVWTQFRAIFKRYKSYMSSNSKPEKDIIKLLGVSTGALVSCSPSESLAQVTPRENAQQESLQPFLKTSFPSTEQLSEELVVHFIPDLTSYIHQKEESQVTSRVPVAITTVKLLGMLPEAQMALFLPPLLLDIAYILRSRSQDARDIVRRTLAEATAILGPSYIQWILKELRTALVKGYQLHVLCYTVHSILVSTTDQLKPGDLDHCLEDFVSIIMDDIFGIVGQEKDAENYVTSMREVKNSRSFDSMELLAKSATVRHVIKLIEPLFTILTGNITPRQSRKIDELLRRIGIGLSRNPLAGSRDMLTFAYQIIQELYKETKSAAEAQVTNDELNRQRFLVQLSGTNKTSRTTASSSMYKVAKFALDLLRSTLQKHNTLLQPENVHGFLPVLGDALVQNQEDVKISAMRTLSAIIKLPMAELDENTDLYLLEAVKVVKNSASTNGEASQAALKLVAAILRERKSVKIRDSNLAYLLQRIIPDLEEPDRQGVTFNFIRAVMSRKLMLPEVYDASKKIGMIMVTNQSQCARDVARGVFVHFVLEYPQSQARWNKQIKFIIRNLSYQYPEGRQSIMEASHMLLTKVGQSVAQELISRLFIPLVLIMANDEDAGCRQIAGALIGQCFTKADREQIQSLLKVLQAWVREADNPTLTKIGLQTYKILFEVSDARAEKEVLSLLTAVVHIIQEAPQNASNGSFEPLHHALQLLSKITTAFPNLTLTQQQTRLWSQVRLLLTYPHPWIQAGSASLVGAWFHDLAMTSKGSLGDLPLTGSHGLELSKGAQLETLTHSLHTLKRYSLSKDLSAQLVRNMIFLGRLFNANGLEMDSLKLKEISKAEDRDEYDEIATSEDEDEAKARNSTTQDGKCLAITHLLTQLSSILRHEPQKLTTASLLPKQSSLHILSALIHTTPTPTLLPLLAHTILPPLAHLTDPSLPPPHSTDPTFTSTYRDLTTSASEVIDLIERKVGSDGYIQAMTATQRFRREKREQRKTKRKLELVRNPEAATREKRRRVEKEKRRKKGMRDGFRRGRKGM